MATEHNLENYTIRETDSGNFEIEKPDGTVILRHDDANDVIELIEALGGTTQIADLADATSGATVYDSSTGELTADVNNDSVNTDSLSGTEILDPNATDFGAEVNSRKADIPNGGTLIVPPVQYDASTTALIDKELTLRSWGGTQISTPRAPTITKQADIPIIETEAESSLIGIEMASAVADTTPGILAHRQLDAERVIGDGLGSHVVHMLEREADDNLNFSRIEVGARNCGGDVVRLENTTGGGANTNAMRICITKSFQNSGYACNILDGFGNRVDVQLVEGDSHTGGIRFGSSDNWGLLQHAEGAFDGIVFDESSNRAEIGYAFGLNNRSVWTFANNELIELQETEYTDIEKRFRPHTIGAGIEIRGDSLSGATAGNAQGTSNGFGVQPENLSGITGDFDGQTRPDDGTNTSNRGILCVWDATASVWVPQDGSAEFA